MNVILKNFNVIFPNFLYSKHRRIMIFFGHESSKVEMHELKITVNKKRGLGLIIESIFFVDHRIKFQDSN